MLVIRIIFIGKTKESWLKEALREYQERLRGELRVEWIEVRDNEKLIAQVERGAVLLDPAGKLMESERFTDYLYKKIEAGGARLTLVIGGPDGLPTELRSAGHDLLSLSPMTLTHQMTRLLLLEQIYRATQIRGGRPYHK